MSKKSSKLKYPYDYNYFSEKEQRFILRIINWDRILQLRKQQRHWKLTKARQNYLCIFCDAEIFKEDDYQKFYRRTHSPLHACLTCFETYRTEHKELFKKREWFEPNYNTNDNS